MEPLVLQQKLMGSPFTIHVYRTPRQSRDEVLSAMRLALAEVARLEDLLTDFRDSPFNHINTMAGVEPVKVPAEVFDLISQALKISADSSGAFDISYAAVGHLWREAKARGVPPTQHELDEARSYVDYKQIQMNPFNQTVYLPSSHMKIGLGGIGKGYAVDQAFALMRHLGMVNFYINGAGDIRVHASPDAPRPWRIAVRNPLSVQHKPMGVVALSSGGMATSGDYERFFRYQGKNYHHVLNVKTGQPTDEVASVTVISESALLCDVYATTAMTLGPEDGIAFLQNRAHTTGFLVKKNGGCLFCEGFHEKL